MDLPASFLEVDGSVVVNFGILTGREATIAEIDRLAHSLFTAGADEMRIVAQRIQDYGGGVETVLHQVIVRADILGAEQLQRLCEMWAHDCDADRHVAPL